MFTHRIMTINIQCFTQQFVTGDRAVNSEWSSVLKHTRRSAETVSFGVIDIYRIRGHQVRSRLGCSSPVYWCLPCFTPTPLTVYSYSEHWEVRWIPTEVQESLKILFIQLNPRMKGRKTKPLKKRTWEKRTFISVSFTNQDLHLLLHLYYTRFYLIKSIFQFFFSSR